MLVGVGIDVGEEVEVEVEVVSGVEGAGILGIVPEEDAFSSGPSIQCQYSLLKLQPLDFNLCLFKDGFYLSKSAFETS